MHNNPSKEMDTTNQDWYNTIKKGSELQNLKGQLLIDWMIWYGHFKYRKVANRSLTRIQSCSETKTI